MTERDPVLLLSALIYLALSLRAQVLLTLNSDLAGAFGVGASRHRLAFIVLLAVVVAVRQTTRRSPATAGPAGRQIPGGDRDALESH